MKKKPTYTHPEFAKYIEKLITRHGTSSWNRLFYIIREEAVKIVEELVANDKLMYAGAQIELPPPEAENKIKNKPGYPKKPQIRQKHRYRESK